MTAFYLIVMTLLGVATAILALKGAGITFAILTFGAGLVLGIFIVTAFAYGLMLAPGVFLKSGLGWGISILLMVSLAVAPGLTGRSIEAREKQAFENRSKEPAGTVGTVRTIDFVGQTPRNRDEIRYILQDGYAEAVRILDKGKVVAAFSGRLALQTADFASLPPTDLTVVRVEENASRRSLRTLLFRTGFRKELSIYTGPAEATDKAELLARNITHEYAVTTIPFVASPDFGGMGNSSAEGGYKAFQLPGKLGEEKSLTWMLASLGVKPHKAGADPNMDDAGKRLARELDMPSAHPGSLATMAIQYARELQKSDEVKDSDARLIARLAQSDDDRVKRDALWAVSRNPALRSFFLGSVFAALAGEPSEVSRDFAVSILFRLKQNPLTAEETEKHSVILQNLLQMAENQDWSLEKLNLFTVTQTAGIKVAPYFRNRPLNASREGEVLNGIQTLLENMSPEDRAAAMREYLALLRWAVENRIYVNKGLIFAWHAGYQDDVKELLPLLRPRYRESLLKSISEAKAKAL